MHADAYAFVQSVAAKRPSGLVVEIGGRNVNGSVRSLFEPDPYVSVDVRDGPGVDVVADGAEYVPPTPAACVICCEVLEHTPQAEAICRHALEILAPGGHFILTAAGASRMPHSAVDGGPLRPGEYYRNIWEHDLRWWLTPFAAAAITENAHVGDIYAVAVKA